MTTVSDLIGKIRAVDVGSLVKSIVKENEKAILDLNREKQIYQEGIDSKGQSLFTYERSTESQWRHEYETGFIQDPKGNEGRAKAFGRSYNMFWSGSSYNSFRLFLRGATSLFITASPLARQKLISNSNPDIFGLTEENSRIVNEEIILPALNEKIKQQLL